MRLRFVLALAILGGLAFSELNAQQTAKITSSNIAYLEYLPQDYGKNNNKYPVVIFLHGIGERGVNSNDATALKNSVQTVANVGLARYIKYGTQYPFIVISPQLKSSYGTWPANYVMDVVNHVKKNLRIDEQRIYITGLSLGGFGTWTTLSAYPDVFAAAVPICSGGNTLGKACTIASRNVPLWAFHGTSDAVVAYGVTTNMVNAINACSPKPSPLAKTTLFSGLGHNIWDKVYKETNALNWMLTFRKGSSGGATTPNKPPVANAGTDKTTSGSSITLTGSGTDPDGSITAYKWTQYGGAPATLANANTSKVTISGLKTGKYYFRLTVTDNDGATAFDNMLVNVAGGAQSSPAPGPNVAPIANAGPDLRITSTSVTLNGSATDSDGWITGYKWTQYGGAAASLSNANTAKLTIGGLKEGKYYFRLTATDNMGASAFDNVLVVVNKGGSAAANIPPKANAGPDIRVSNVTSVQLTGSATDADGRIVSYEWSQYGGKPLTLQHASSPAVTATGLNTGKYYLRLTVKDDDGAVDQDNVLIVVNEG